jgi:predicted MFS family arabinose efflux permease
VAGPITELANWRVGVFTVGVLCAFSAALFISLVPAPRGFVPRRFVPRLARKRGVRNHGTHLSLITLLRANLTSPRLFALYAQGFLLMGGFVALYNYLGFRLADDPFNLPQALISLVFIAYLAGTWSSAQAGILAARSGRWAVLLSSLVCMTAGVLLTLSTMLVIVLLGVLLATAGFFAAHAIASGWTGATAQIGRAQASSLYNLAYYAGSSLFGWLGGVFFVQWGWGGTVAMVAGLAGLAAVITVVALRPQPRQP